MHPSASFRLSLRQRALPAVLGFPGAVLLLQIFQALAGHVMPANVWEQTIGGSFVGAVVLVLVSCRHGVILTEDELVVRNGWRRRIPRAGIERLEVRRVLGVSQVVVRTKDGRYTTLPAPTSFLDSQFEAKARELTRWWQAGA
ncbi:MULTISPECIES: hypothetical protein [Streptomyces]|uniref:DUF304 domain-containing protein n=2 Tax=Streptomyces TaxID=1883 RepID=A0ABV9IUT0_9ACTN